MCTHSAVSQFSDAGAGEIKPKAKARARKKKECGMRELVHWLYLHRFDRHNNEQHLEHKSLSIYFRLKSILLQHFSIVTWILFFVRFFSSLVDDNKSIVRFQVVESGKCQL